jgi:chorismate mutase
MSERPGRRESEPGPSGRGSGRQHVESPSGPAEGQERETGPTAVRALRGATTVDVDDKDHLFERVIALLEALFERNGIHHDDLISVLFTATGDIRSAFPAEAARKFGLGDVPLICARELDIEGGTPRCIRVMIHFTSDVPRDQLHHVYLEGARNLRDDLPD